MKRRYVLFPSVWRALGVKHPLVMIITAAIAFGLLAAIADRPSRRVITLSAAAVAPATTTRTADASIEAPSYRIAEMRVQEGNSLWTRSVEFRGNHDPRKWIHEVKNLNGWQRIPALWRNQQVLVPDWRESL